MKYVSYLGAGLNVITDSRHRISKFYARYYKNRFLFADDRSFDELSKLDLLKNVKSSKVDIDSGNHEFYFKQKQDKFRIFLG